MAEINFERIKFFLGEIKEAKFQLAEFAPLSEQELISDPVRMGCIKYNFIVAIQAAVDICNHIVSRKGTRPPRNYGDCFLKLSELSIIDRDFARKLAQMAKFRNLLIHLYGEVEDRQVYQILDSHLSDLDRFVERIASLVK